MGLRRCAADGKPFTGRPAAVYMTFFPLPGMRRCYRSYICPDHASAMGELIDIETNALAADPDDETSICPECGQTGFDGFEATYFDIYAPGLERRRIELWMCPASAERVRPRYVKFGTLLPDRDAETTESRGRVESVWQAYA